MFPRLAAFAVRGASLNCGACAALHAAPILGSQAGAFNALLVSSRPTAFSAVFPSPTSSASPFGLTFATAAAAQPSPSQADATQSATSATSTSAPIELHAGLKAQQQAKEYAFDLAYSPDYAESVKPVHRPPVKLHERLGFQTIQFARRTFDACTGYKHDAAQTEAQWLRRMIFLETVAGVPGMVAGVLRHLMSLRTMRKDHGWIMTMLEEAENERMHLLTFIKLRQPGLLFRLMVILAQGVYFNVYFISYMISPKFCHSLVGYLEEEAVLTYTHCINDIDSGKLEAWRNKPAPEIGINYWKLPKDAKMRDLIMAIRADEACHSYVNHRLSELKRDDENPFAGKHSGQDPSEKVKQDLKA